MKELLQKRRALFMALVAGIVISVVLVKSRPAMEHTNNAKKAVPVNVITLKQYSIAPTITGYGVVEPDVLLNLKAEINGAVTYIHPQLRKGELIAKDTLVLTVDDRDYRLALQQAKADVAVSKANLRELDLNLDDVKVNLSLVKQKLTLANKELARMQNLLKKKSISQSNVDSQQSAVIQLKQEVQNLQNQLNTLPAQRDVMLAKIIISEASVETQQRNLERTQIVMPFDGRITDLSVEENQFVSQGAGLFSTQTINKVLINVQLPVERFQSLARTMPQGQMPFEKTVLSFSASQIFEMLGVEAEVRLAENPDIRWPAKVERISDNLDPSTRTLGIMVSVENPYQKVQPGVRPPLIAEMYTEVIIRSQPQPFFVLPRDALHEGSVYTVSTENPDELQKITVEPDYQFGSVALFKEGFEEGQRLVVSDLFPAVNGMKLAPFDDVTMQKNIEQWVAQP
ncbi:hypothetical protein A9Q99_14045 [Gammaproteobacteria bacterium 45_16_T64]|nr:hypothetical protein A9Q99_14045 [Gammaproteobacteria bacterium 45_16_T64]